MPCWVSRCALPFTMQSVTLQREQGSRGLKCHYVEKY